MEKGYFKGFGFARERGLEFEWRTKRESLSNDEFIKWLTEIGYERYRKLDKKFNKKVKDTVQKGSVGRDTKGAKSDTKHEDLANDLKPEQVNQEAKKLVSEEEKTEVRVVLNALRSLIRELIKKYD